MIQTGFSIFFSVINSVLIICLPRHWVSLPLLIAALYMPSGVGVEVGVLSFSVLRIIIAAGFARIFIRRERLANGINTLDWFVILFSIWAIISSIFHQNAMSSFVYRLGIIYNISGSYFLIRIFIKSIDEAAHLTAIVAILLIPISLEMIYEKMQSFNLFSIIGGVPEIPEIRLETVRAQGPFAHAILAGTIGAVYFPQMVGLWKFHRKIASSGIIACLVVVVTCASSGPILTGLTTCFAVAMWPIRNRTRILFWMTVIGYVALDIIMKAPAYYLLSRIDVVGGSTGWHRAKLIESAITHIDEWWLFGTDYTRHWTPTGLDISEIHTDITNQYIFWGVIGGLPLTLLFVFMIFKCFFIIGSLVKQDDFTINKKLFSWSLGATLFGLAIASISISFFDQSFLFFPLTFAVISSISFLNSKQF
jgi:hypothetical protein